MTLPSTTFTEYQKFISKDPLQDGASAYLLSNKWLFKLKRAIKLGQEFNLPITNEHLLENGRIKLHLKSPQDYHIIPESAWKFLYEKYGGGPEIQTCISLNSLDNTFTFVPPPYHFIIQSDNDFSMNIEISPSKKISDIKDIITKSWPSKTDFAIIDYVGSQKHRELPENRTIIELLLKDGQSLFVQPRTNNQEARSQIYETSGPGQRGLDNPFNLCYMNASIQCISHIQPFINIFNNDLLTLCESKFPNEKLISKQLVNLISQQWQQNPIRLSPIELQKAMHSINNFITVYSQYDLMEFITNLFDAVCKSTSRIVSKSQTSIKGDGTNTPQKAQEQWSRDCIENSSPLFETCYGQTGETIHCHKCNSDTVLFHSYLALEVPLIKEEKKITVIRVPYDITKQATATLMKPGTLVPENAVYLAKSDKKYTQVPNPNDCNEVYILEVPADPTVRYRLITTHDSDGVEASLPFLVPAPTTEEAIKERCKSLFNEITFDAPLDSPPLNSPTFLTGPAISVTIGKSDKHQKVIMKPNPDTLDIMDCIKALVSADEVQDTWKCDKCNEKVHISKQTGIIRTPEVLILHLQRFENHGLIYEKDSRTVSYPELLDLTSITQNNGDIFNLVAVAEHVGRYESGHYTACCLNPEDHKWYRFNDSMVETVSADIVHSHNAYVLFYQKVK